MTFLPFTPKKDIDEYLTNNLNVMSYRELTENPLYADLFVPLDFFNLFWQVHELILFNKQKPLKILHYLLNLPLNQRQLYYLCESLLLSFNILIIKLPSASEDDPFLKICVDFISHESDKIGKRLFPDLYKHDYIYSFEIVKKKVNLIADHTGKLKYLHSTKIDYLQHNYLNKSEDQSAFDALCDLEIERINIIVNISQSAPCTGNPALLPSAAAKSINVDSTDAACSVSANSKLIRKFIVEKIDAIHPSKWQYAFMTKDDYNLFLDLLTNFFSNNEVDYNREIVLQDHCKTRLCHVLNSIYRNFCRSPLKKDKYFLNFLKFLSIFKDQTTSQIYSDISRSN